MKENPYFGPGDEPRGILIAPQKKSIWQKVGAGSLSISIILHVLLLVVGLFWILRSVPQDEGKGKVVDFQGKSGGGTPVSETKATQQRARMPQPDMSHVVAVGATGDLTMPEPEETSRMTSIGKLSPGGLSGGLGSDGSGRGGRKGPGTGDGWDSGMTGGKGSKNPFGVIDPNKDALAGTFYDLKQTRNGQPTGMTDSKMREELMEITRRGFKESAFDDYFKAKRELYQTKFYIPTIPADGAPAAFEVEKEVQPRMWVVVYRGAVKAPKSGRFRFVGECDDFLVVRFNNRPVFDYGYTMAGTGTHVNGRADDFNGTNDLPELAKEVRKLTPMKLPITMYTYANTAKHNQMIGGLAVGPEFQVEAGKTYPIEIMIGEIPGGFFSLELLIEEIGAKYGKDPAGFPVLPLFRLDHSLPEAKPDSAPFDPDGPVWPFASSTGNREI